MWYLFGDERLSFNARQFIEMSAVAGNTILVSSITLIEIVYLIEKRRITAESLTRLADVLLDQQTVFEEYHANLAIARQLANIPRTQVPDMPDRIIAATALLHSVPVISRDKRIRLSAIETIW